MKRKPYKRKLNARILATARPRDRAYLIWDDGTDGLALCTWLFIYSRHNRSRWYTIGRAYALGLADARKAARELRVLVDKGIDVQAEKVSQRSKGTFETLAHEYREQFAKKHNRSWAQADYLVQKHLIPRWGKLPANSINRSDVKALMRSIAAPVTANQTLAAASAIFSWAVKEEIVKVNPCANVDRHEVRSRERVLSDSELPLFVAAFEKTGVMGRALQLILLLGQRPGEVTHMRWEHLRDGWWEMPGKPTEVWPGTKNGENHRVWIPKPALTLLGDISAGEGYVLTDARGRRVKQLDGVMREICGKLNILDKVTPHDLRRTHGTKITALGFGKDAMNRVQNHREGGISSVYDRHGYSEENKRIMETVATAIMALAEGRSDEKVLTFPRKPS